MQILHRFDLFYRDIILSERIEADAEIYRKNDSIPDRRSDIFAYRDTFPRIYSLDNDADRRSCAVDYLHHKHKNQNERYYRPLSCRLCDNHITRIHCRLYCQPRASHEGLGLFRGKIQRSRSNMSAFLCPVVLTLYSRYSALLLFPPTFR